MRRWHYTPVAGCGETRRLGEGSVCSLEGGHTPGTVGRRSTLGAPLAPFELAFQCAETVARLAVNFSPDTLAIVPWTRLFSSLKHTHTRVVAGPDSGKVLAK